MASGMVDEMPRDLGGEVVTDMELRPEATISTGVGSLRQMSLNIISDILTNLKNVRTKMATKNHGGHVPLQRNSTKPSTNIDLDVNHNPACKPDVNTHTEYCNPGFQSDQHHDMVPTSDNDNIHQLPVNPHPEMPIFMPQEEMNESMRDRVGRELNDIFPDDRVRRETLQSTLEAILCAPTVQLLMDAVLRTFRVNHHVLQHWGIEEGSLVAVDPVDAIGVVAMKVEFSTNMLRLSWDEFSYGSDFLTFVSTLNSRLREERRQPTHAEHIATHLAYCILSNGTHYPQSFKPLGTPGFRPLQYISISDPGKGHIQTSRYTELLKGTLFNVEEEVDIDADSYKSDSKISPLLNLSQVRLHVGDSAPVSYFLGKALVLSADNSHDLQMMACAATTAFSYGASECTVCTCGLSTGQVVRFMRALCSKVNRQDSQCLSAIWHLDRSLLHDHECPQPVECTATNDISRMALEMTSIGGFDKVSLDFINTSSMDIVDRVGFDEALAFNHEAHMRGIWTQFATGCSSKQVKNALLTGVDVIRVRDITINSAFSQDQNSNMAEDFQQLLQVRDRAAESVRGRGGNLLARLNTVFAEGSITRPQNETRKRLFKALKTKSGKGIKHILSRCDVVPPSRPGSDLEDLTRRIVSSSAPILKEVADSDIQWRSFVQRLESALAVSDFDCLREEYQSEPWCTFRRRLKLLQS